MNQEKVLHREVKVQTAAVELEGDLFIPAQAQGVVAFVHGSGSSRHSSRNQFVARVLQEAGLITLLFDLLTPAEERIDMVTRELRFDIPLLARRTQGAVEWLEQQPELRHQPIGLFGASTGAAAALIAAANLPQSVRAVVSRGGRPDLAAEALPRVQAPTLLIVGSKDIGVIELNRAAFARLPPTLPKALKIVPGASHLFEEPGTLEQAARLAQMWFRQYLQSTPAA